MCGRISQFEKSTIKVQVMLEFKFLVFLDCFKVYFFIGTLLLASLMLVFPIFLFLLLELFKQSSLNAALS